MYYNVPDFPLHLGIFLRFIALLCRGSGAYKSATNTIASIKWFAALLHPPSVQVCEAVLVNVSLKGLKAKLSRPVRQKLPFCLEHMCAFYHSLNFDDPKHLSCWCAMLLGFFGCFRLSNLVPTSKAKYDTLKHLRRDDIKFEKDIVLIFYKWSKTNQNCQKVSWIPICAVKDPRFNVKKFMKKLFKCVKASDDAPLFSYNSNRFHTRYSLVRMLDKCIFEAGLSLPDFSWHSFRRGSAVFAFELGLADSAVQLLGDWSSMAFKHYLEFAFLKKVSVAEKIAKSFDKQVRQL